jgi:hypothetical protein
VVISAPKRARNFLFTVASINISSLRDDGKLGIHVRTKELDSPFAQLPRNHPHPNLVSKSNDKPLSKPKHGQ